VRATHTQRRVSVVWLFRRASLACPDEGVWAYVAWGGAAVRGRGSVWEFTNLSPYFGYQSSSRTSMPLPSRSFLKHCKIGATIVIRVSVVWLFRRASLACPDEGVWAYVGWGGAAVRGRALFGSLRTCRPTSDTSPAAGPQSRFLPVLFQTRQDRNHDNDSGECSLAI